MIDSPSSSRDAASRRAALKPTRWGDDSVTMNAEAAAPAPVAMVGHGRFLGESRQYFRLLSRDAVMLIVTLGLYRFWVASDIRRYLWSNTEIAGDELEYTGDPRELFVGFMVIVVVLCPLFAASSVA